MATDCLLLTNSSSYPSLRTILQRHKIQFSKDHSTTLQHFAEFKKDVQYSEEKNHGEKTCRTRLFLTSSPSVDSKHSAVRDEIRAVVSEAHKLNMRPFVFIQRHAYSAVYDGKEVAVKVITRDKLSNLEFANKFLPREIEVLSKVNHENIIKVYKIFNFPKKVYIFMELVKDDLLGYVRSRGRLKESEAHSFFRTDGQCYEVPPWIEHSAQRSEM
ncbi:hypothetical protein CEXT_67291 [Caerostris extrusa]|uniref:Protein kinase domain-containing protein n=1 Tax=Caerostris extrusa TaxID=172846 RepID=A0AAV4UTF5_CAEEX|nr:hypothetical protein CEXT_67291 [Caerostris extrusa]